MYKPDRWVIVRMKKNKKDPVFTLKLLAGWSGGYLDGQSWRMNSGISTVTKDGDYYQVNGKSGSCYLCHKSGYGLNLIMGGIVDQLKRFPEAEVEVLSEKEALNLFSHSMT